MRKCKNYDELEELVRSITLDFHIEVQDNTTYSEQSFFRDNVARAKYPSEKTPRDLTPLNSEPDGNCFPNSVSSIVYGHENHRKSIHARLIVVGVLFKSMLLEDKYLSYSRNDDENILTMQFAMYSGAYNYVRTDAWNPTVIEEIYRKELLILKGDIKYCGMWQMYQLANM